MKRLYRKPFDYDDSMDKQDIINRLFDLSTMLQESPDEGWCRVNNELNHSDKHFNKSPEELINRLINKNLNERLGCRSDITSSFDTKTMSKENILAECILENLEEIADWLIDDDKPLLTIDAQIRDYDTTEPVNIGYGFINGLKGFTTSGARIVLARDKNNHEGFAVRTMFPFFDESCSEYNGMNGLALLRENETFKSAEPKEQEYIRTLVTHRNIYARKGEKGIRYVLIDTRKKREPIRYTVYEDNDTKQLKISTKDGHKKTIDCPYALNSKQKGLLNFPEDINYEQFQTDFPEFCETIDISQKIVNDERNFRRKQRVQQAQNLKSGLTDNETNKKTKTQRQPE